MRIQYKQQKFQADAAKAVVDVFAGQPYLTPTYMVDKGLGEKQIDMSISGNKANMEKAIDFTGWSNQKIVPELNDQMILEHLQKIQRTNQIAPSEKLEGRDNGYNFTIEMETGVGKTYTYIKTMYELNKAYGWSKFIIVVPSIAIREGVYKSFEMTQDHFAEEYGKKIRFFIYNSRQLTNIDHFASDSSINVMIINSQAFNSTGKDARRIYMKLDEFQSRRPIDIIAKTNPILIIDEPQSVEGKKTKERLKEFNPLITLRYSATPRDYYNLVYRLDAMDAYNKQLVKKIAVKGITQSGVTATTSYVYLESINLSKKAPTATIQFDYKGKNKIRQVTRVVEEGYNLYDNSGELEEYKDGYVVKHIDGRDDSIEFLNGIKLYAGDIAGEVGEDQLRRIQIRETILSHIQRERQLYYKGIKVLSLFFIDEVAKYRQYDEAGNPVNGIYADMFEEEYEDIVNNMQLQYSEDDYLKYLSSLSPQDTHAGYFSIDKKGKMIDSKFKKAEAGSDDADAYDLIMKNKELLLDRDPKRSPVRFIFSHSALKEGWDNPNVFQICTLKQSSSDVRKRQEVGRGLRLCVNQDGERMDANALGGDVHNVNVLTVIASESYDKFAKDLQAEIAENITGRPRKVNADLFAFKTVTGETGEKIVIDTELAETIYYHLIIDGYVDSKGGLTEKYYEDKANGEIHIAKLAEDIKTAVIELVDSIYDSNKTKPENARSNNIELKVDEDKLAMPQFKELWSKINSKTVYSVDFDSDELIGKAVAALDSKLHVAKVYFKIEGGEMDKIESGDHLMIGEAFEKKDSKIYDANVSASATIEYDLVGELVEETGLTRHDIVRILQGIEPVTFEQFKVNPADFIIKAAALINDEKASVIIQHITYNVLEDKYDMEEVFTQPSLRGKLGKNAIRTEKHLYDHLIYDSSREKEFAEELDISSDVAVYVKLPGGFFISTPVGKYNPDWAIAFYEGNVKHIYFVAETKGTLDTLDLKGHISGVEGAKISCAKEHFKAISNDDVVYSVVDGYQALMEKVMK